MSSARPFRLVECEVTRPGSEANALANPEVAALWAEGWSVALHWIRVQKRNPDSTEETFMMLVMAPPRDLGSNEAERAALAALITSITEGQVKSAEGRTKSDRYGRIAVAVLGGVAVLQVAQVVLAFVAAAS